MQELMMPTYDFQTGQKLFADLTETTAPQEAKPLLEMTRSLFGFVPNLAVAMAAEPQALGAYLQVLGSFDGGSLSPVEQQLVMIVASQTNEAPYSVAVHGTLALKLGASAEVIDAASHGRPIADPKIAALQRFTKALILGRTQVSDADLEGIQAAGFDRKAIVAIVLAVSAKFFANAIAHIAQPAVDAGFAAALPTTANK
jgi:uncharacterized peroxidase-related enzyme